MVKLYPDISRQYLPYDHPAGIRALIVAHQIKQAWIVETEIWPTLFTLLAKYNIPFMLVNARMSDKSYQRWRSLTPLLSYLLQYPSQILTKSPEDQQKFRHFIDQPDKVRAIGNLKFCGQIGNSNTQQRRQPPQSKADGSQPLYWLCVSTHPGEHDQVIGAYQEVLQTSPTLKLVIAPRNPKDAQLIAQQLSKQQISHQVSSKSSADEPIDAVRIIDQIGVLAAYYRQADLTFIGGSFINHGGQNPLEAIAHGLVTLMGPHTHNFSEVYGWIEQMYPQLRLSLDNTLAKQLRWLIEHPQERVEMGRNLARQSKIKGKKILNSYQIALEIAK